MRIVLDTNVLVSALLKPGSVPARAVAVVTGGGAAVVLLYDDRVLAEYRDVLGRRKLGIDPVEAERLCGEIVVVGDRVAAEPLVIELPDPNDLPFVEVAVTGRADAIVTGNKRHFPAKSCGALVLSPREFLDRMMDELGTS